MRVEGRIKVWSFFLPFWALLKRDLVRSLRKSLPVTMLFCLFVVTSLIVLAYWPGNYEDLARLRQAEVAAMLFMALLFGGALTIPASAAGSLSLEFERDSMDLLSLTLIGPVGLFCGKLFNALGLFFFLAVGCLPIIASLYFLQGLDVIHLVVPMALVVCTGIAIGSVSVMFSVMLRRTIPAVLLSYIAAAIVLGAHFILVIVAIELLRMWWFSGRIQEWLESYSPVVGIVGMFEPGMAPNLPRQFGHLGAITLISAIVAIGLIIRKHRRDPVQAVVRRRLWGRAGSRKTAVRRFAPPIGDHEPVILARARRYGVMNSRRWRRRIFWGIVALSLVGIYLLAMEFAGRDNAAIPIIWASGYMIVVAILAPSLAAANLPREHEQGNIDMLRVSLLTPREVVVGQFKSGLNLLLIFLGPLWVIAIFMAPFAALEESAFVVMVEAMITTLVTGILGIAVSLPLSVCTRRSIPALLASTLVLGLWLLGFMLMAMCVTEFGRRSYATGVSEQGIVNFFSFFSPPMAFFNYLVEAFPQRIAHGPWFVSVVAALVCSYLMTNFAVRLYAKFGMQDR